MCVSETRGAPQGGARLRLESPGAPSITKEPPTSHHDHFADTRPTRVHHPLPNADQIFIGVLSSDCPCTILLFFCVDALAAPIIVAYPRPPVFTASARRRAAPCRPNRGT